MSDKRQHYFKAMGIELWRSRDQEVYPERITDHDEDKIISVSGKDNWQQLEQNVSSCKSCSLHQTRTQTVFGAGSVQADVLVIGEAPGVDEDRLGEPFVGKAGQLLTLMLRACSLERDAVYITNILKCRPPDNRDPHIDEVLACSNYLKQQISMVNPEVILAVGRIAAQNLLHSNETIGHLRAKQHVLPEMNIPVIVTYHPAYLLRSPAQKAKAWDDLKMLKLLLQS